MSIFSKYIESKKEEFNKVKQLSKQEKKQYFADYYAGPLAITIIVIAAIIIFIVQINQNNYKVVLNVTVVDGGVGNLDSWHDQLSEMFNADNKDTKVTISEKNVLFVGNNMDIDTYEKLNTMFYSEDIDIFIGATNAINRFGNASYFMDLSTLLSDEVMATLKEKEMLYYLTFKDSEEDGEDIEIPIGILIDDTKCDKDANFNHEPAILAVSVSTPNRENVIKFIDYVLE